ncbi:MAG: signal recognition particle-docking protein FtsY [Candidatus Desulfofervidus sp.]|nr:signal recognition particle-docking protein FtsY [Candidatus Desulfofervidus sp.]
MLNWFKKKKKQEEKPTPKPSGRLSRLKDKLLKTRQNFSERINHLFSGKKEIDEHTLEELEEILIMADLGVEATQKLIQTLTQKSSHKEINTIDQLKQDLKQEILNFLQIEAPPLDVEKSKPFVIMLVGVNGVGKTTAIAKLAKYYKEQGKKNLLIAADTFRAAAIEQLEVWAERVGAEIYKQQPGADPAAVVFDGLQVAKKQEIDIVLVDTAGRLHTKINLMEELKKIKRVMGKTIPQAPHEIWLVLDATTGQNVISQVKMFHEALGITGLILTKLDGTAKGGIIVNTSYNFNIPLRFIGIGEHLQDLQPFNAYEFVEALL